MENLDRRMLLAGLGLVGAAAAASASAGTLNPPAGPVTASGKTTTEIEPRTAVNATNTPGDATSVFNIPSAGSFYLTGNVTGASGKNGILIGSNNVSLDLNGFQLLGVAGSLAGITDGGNNRGNAVIRNGTIRAWGGAGIDVSHSFDSLLSQLIVADCTGKGMSVGDACVLRDCMVRNNVAHNIASGANANLIHCTSVSSFGGDGMNLGANCMVTASSANSNQGVGISVGAGALIENCVANGNQDGIGAGDNSRISHCTVSGNIIAGVRVNSFCVIDGCVVNANGHRGIQAGFADTDGSYVISNNIVCGNGTGQGGFGFSAGIYLFGHHGRIDGNHVAENKGDGITWDTSGPLGHNVVVRNTLISNTAFQIRMWGVPGQGNPGDNDVGPLNSAATSTSPWANLQFF
jgi:hypothetical protein